MATISNVRLFPVNGHKTIKANGEFTLDESITVKFTLMNGTKGMFVGLPGDYYQPKDGGEKKWAPKVTVSEEFSKQLNKAILDAYNKKTNSKSSFDQGKSKAGTEDQSNVPF